MVLSQTEASTVTPGPVLGRCGQDEGQELSGDVSPKCQGLTRSPGEASAGAPGVLMSQGSLWEFVSEQSSIFPTAQFEHLFWEKCDLKKSKVLPCGSQ